MPPKVKPLLIALILGPVVASFLLFAGGFIGEAIGGEDGVVLGLSIGFALGITQWIFLIIKRENLRKTWGSKLPLALQELPKPSEDKWQQKQQLPKRRLQRERSQGTEKVWWLGPIILAAMVLFLLAFHIVFSSDNGVTAIAKSYLTFRLTFISLSSFIHYWNEEVTFQQKLTDNLLINLVNRLESKGWLKREAP